MALQSKLRQARAVLADWRYIPFYAQRRVRARGLRTSIADNLARLVRPASPASDNPLAQALHNDGFAALGPLFSPAQVAEIREWLSARQVSDPYRPGKAFLPDDDDARHPESHVAYHGNADVLAAPHLLELANRPDILNAVGAFLGCKPTIGYLAAWWSYPTAIGPQQAENFHRDVDDWRFVKLFVYLTDVGDRNGPHVYVHGSSSSPRLRAIRRYTDQEIGEAFGTDAIRYKSGAAGTGFLEDTYGFHKGQPVQEGRRLMFQAVYSLFPLPYGPRTPVAARRSLPNARDIDPWTNRIYLRD